MIPLLARRIGVDTISKIESAAPRRLLEAASLEREGLVVGAVYLYGYVAEINLAAAYFRLIGYRPNTEITAEVRKRIIALARQGRLMGRDPHDVLGWARLLVVTKKQRGIGYPRGFRGEIILRAASLYARWRPGLRYRVTVPTPSEIGIVRSSAEWFEENYVRLWR
jgi:hypothetical protein